MDTGNRCNYTCTFTPKKYNLFCPSEIQGKNLDFSSSDYHQNAKNTFIKGVLRMIKKIFDFMAMHVLTFMYTVYRNAFTLLSGFYMLNVTFLSKKSKFMILR